MIVRVLGSAAGGGVPQWNCGCTNCARARHGEAPVRSQSSIAVGTGEAWMLFNASIDLPKQLAGAPELWPKQRRETPFRAILLTDANVDHTAGLGELRQAPDPFVVVSSLVTKELLARERAFRRFDRPPQRWLTIKGDGADVAAKIDPVLDRHFEICAHDVPGLLPGYAGRGEQPGAVFAYTVRDLTTGRLLLVAPVFAAIDDRLRALIEDADLALLDGTFFSEDELGPLKLLPKGAGALGHIPIGGAHGTLTLTEGVRGRTAFVHINNTNPILDPGSAERALVDRANCIVAADGDVFRL